MDLQHLRASDGTGEAVLAHVQSTRTIGSTVLDLDNVENWNTKCIAVTGTPAANGYIATAGMTIMYGHLTAGDFIIDGYAPGYSDNGNATTDIAIIKMTTNWADALVDLLGVALKDNGKLKPSTSWFDPEEEWEYASSTSITVPSDATTKYSPGVIIRLVQTTGGTKYFMVTGVTATLLTVKSISGTLVNEAITAPFYSYDMSPQGAPIATVTPEKLSTEAQGRVLIATVTLGSAGANIDFSSIPQTFRHLELRTNALLVSGGDAGGNLYFNSDTTTTNYNMQILDMNGATITGSTSNSAASLIHSGSNNNINIIQIPHYTETFNKVAIIESLRIGTSSLRPNRRYQRWNSTGAITAIRLNASPNYASGAIAYLYGMQ